MHIVTHALIGTVPVSYEAENDGLTIATLAPTEQDATAQISSSSRTLLELHGENQSHPAPPDILIISSLQEDGNGRVGTLIATARDAIGCLTDDEVALGRKSIFTIWPPLSFRSGSFPAKPVPMFYGSPDEPLLNFDAHAMTSEDPHALQLIEKMTKIFLDVATTIYLHQSDILVIDNRTAVHGRLPFIADFMRPRINQRSFGKFDFAATKIYRQGATTIMRC
jgi:L-asparagine oxygenase